MKKVYLKNDEVITINTLKNDKSYMITITNDCINIYQIFEDEDDKLIKTIEVV